jgi:hypothetical protein
MIDCISGGRPDRRLSLSARPMDTTYAYGTNPSQLRDRYYEAHDLVLRAWTEKEPFAFNGRYNQQRYVNILAAARSSSRIRRSGFPVPARSRPGAGRRDGLRVLLLSYYGYKMAQNVMQGLLAGDGRLGKDRNPYRAGFAQVVGVARDPAAGARPLHRPAEILLRPLPARRPGGFCRSPRLRDGGYAARWHREPDQMAAEGKAAEGPSHQCLLGDEMQSLARDMKGICRQRLRHRRSPDDVVEQLRELRTTLERRAADAAHAVRQHVEVRPPNTIRGCSPRR